LAGRRLVAGKPEEVTQLLLDLLPGRRFALRVVRLLDEHDERFDPRAGAG